VARRFLCFVWLLAACGSGPAPEPERTVRIRLVDGGGAPVDPEGKTVWWAAQADAEFGTPAGLIEDGAIVLRDVPGEPFVVVALPEGFVVPSQGWPRVVIPAGVTEAVVTLDVGATRTIRVVGRQRKETFYTTAHLAATTDLEPSQHSIEEDGTVHITGLREGARYNLFVCELESDRSALVRDLGANEPWPVIELAPARDIRGRVILPKDCGLACVAVMVDRAVMISGRLEDDGLFRIRGVPKGTWTVVAYTTVGDEYVARHTQAKAGGDAFLDLTIPPK